MYRACAGSCGPSGPRSTAPDRLRSAVRRFASRHRLTGSAVGNGHADETDHGVITVRQPANPQVPHDRHVTGFETLQIFCRVSKILAKSQRSWPQSDQLAQIHETPLVPLQRGRSGMGKDDLQAAVVVKGPSSTTEQHHRGRRSGEQVRAARRGTALLLEASSGRSGSSTTCTPVALSCRRSSLSSFARLRPFAASVEYSHSPQVLDDATTKSLDKTECGRRWSGGACPHTGGQMLVGMAGDPPGPVYSDATQPHHPRSRDTYRYLTPSVPHR
jgi:hypothetical protein